MTFLADADDVFNIFMTLVFGFIAFMGWVGQFMKNKQQGAKRAPQQRAKDGEVQSEIERFLQEVTGDRPPAQERPARPAEARPPERRRPQQKPSRATSSSGARNESSSGARNQSSNASQQRRSAQSNQKRRVANKASSTDVISASDAFEQQGAQYVPPRKPLQPMAPARGRDVVTTLGPGLADELRDPATVRKAIVMNMILGPCKAAGQKRLLD